MSRAANELIKEIEIDFDYCSLTYGTSPCTAVLGTTGEFKCFNTKATCQDLDNYTPEINTLYFTQAEAFSQANKIPSLKDARITPAKLAGGTGKDNPLGERGKLSCTFYDHPWDDSLVDKYYEERPTGDAGTIYNPLEQGTFFPKFRARNPYYIGRAIRIKTGIGSDARYRHYIIEKMDKFSTNPSIIGKDPLKLIDDKRAQCPLASKGSLSASINETDLSITLAPTGIGDTDYPASGKATIGKELVSFTRSGDTVTITARSLNGVTEEHDDGDTFQLAHEFSSMSVDDIIYELLDDFSTIDVSCINTVEWEAEVTNYIPNVYSAIIGKPTSIKELIGELAEQSGFAIGWDDLKQKIILVAIKQPEIGTEAITDDMIIDMTVSDDPSKRISQVWTAYGIIDPLESIEKITNYRSFAININDDAELLSEYAQPAIYKIFSRWIPQYGSAAAENLNERLLARFKNIPRDFKFSLARDKIDSVELGKTRVLRSRHLQNELGHKKDTIIRILSIEEDEDILNIEAEEQLYVLSPDEAHVIIIDTDTANVNLREMHDRLFVGAVSGTVVECIIREGVIVYSINPSYPAFNVGEWAEGVIISLEIEPGAYIVGAGGTGSTIIDMYVGPIIIELGPIGPIFIPGIYI